MHVVSSELCPPLRARPSVCLLFQSFGRTWTQLSASTSMVRKSGRRAYSASRQSEAGRILFVCVDTETLLRASKRRKVAKRASG